MEITAQTFLDTTSKNVTTHFYSAQCGSNESSELWIGTTSGKFVVVDPGLYYDEKLRQRRNSGNMLSPWQPVERLSLVAQVWGGAVPQAAKSQNVTGIIEIARGVIEASSYA